MYQHFYNALAEMIGTTAANNLVLEFAGKTISFPTGSMYQAPLPVAEVEEIPRSQLTNDDAHLISQHLLSAFRLCNAATQTAPSYPTDSQCQCWQHTKHQNRHTNPQWITGQCATDDLQPPRMRRASTQHQL